MLTGYARVSTADQNPDHQTDALARAGVDPANIYLDHASGAKASRPELDKALASANRAGDQQVITRLDRIGRLVFHQSYVPDCAHLQNPSNVGRVGSSANRPWVCSSVRNSEGMRRTLAASPMSDNLPAKPHTTWIAFL
ncbi:recombinase family protein [Paeniglutamicibacter gangotriensis]|uniref:recombinase family protein n=1 Tax=Paeniglutamicibacter gangotriensis TaxID=254787 RepID=UPI0037C4F7EC